MEWKTQELLCYDKVRFKSALPQYMLYRSSYGIKADSVLYKIVDVKATHKDYKTVGGPESSLSDKRRNKDSSLITTSEDKDQFDSVHIVHIRVLSPNSETFAGG
jgi:hypothetical protein